MRIVDFLILLIFTHTYYILDEEKYCFCSKKYVNTVELYVSVNSTTAKNAYERYTYEQFTINVPFPGLSRLLGGLRKVNKN